jgi:tight adherence protein C
MTTYALAVGGALCLVLAVWGYASMTSGERVTVPAVPAGRRRKRDAFLLSTVADVIGAPLTGPAMRLLAPWRTQIRKRIDAAGRPGGMTVTSHARQTAGYVVLFTTISLLLLLSGQRLFALLPLLGALQNEFLLYARMQARQDEIQRSMPDLLDVLAVTVAAGLGFRPALSRVAESMPGALAEEITVTLRQMDLGSPRREAFENLRDRNKAEALGQFVTAILQAEELGAPLSTALMDIAKDMRRGSAQWARRKAQRNTPRITAVTITLTLPALMALVVGALFFGSGGGLGGVLGG